MKASEIKTVITPLGKLQEQFTINKIKATDANYIELESLIGYLEHCKSRAHFIDQELLEILINNFKTLR